MAKVKSTVILVLAFLMALICISSAVATSVEKEELYNATILQLESWLETPGKPVDELERIVNSFESLGNSKMSKGFVDYTSVLLKAVKGEFDFDYRFIVNTLERNEVFQQYINNDINSLSIRTVPEMISYVKGREAEYNGNTAEAISKYMESLNFYDASDRYKALSKKDYSAKYEKAKELANNNDLVGAYFLFAETEGYGDSVQRMEYIVQILGYNPAENAPVTNADNVDSSEPLSIVGVKPAGPGKAEIEWNGGVEPVGVSVYHYFNDNHNEGIPYYFAVEGWEKDPQNGSGTVAGFIPGQKYWIKLTDAAGNMVWKEYSTINESVTINRMIDDKGMGYKKQTGGGTIGISVTTKSLESECRDNISNEQTLIEAKFQVNKVPYETAYGFFWALRLPNGDVVPCGRKQVICKNGRQSLLIDIPWKEIYKTYEKIPEGEYYYYLGIDNHIYVEHRFWLHPKNNTKKPKTTPVPGEEDNPDDPYDDPEYDPEYNPYDDPEYDPYDDYDY